MEGDKTADNEKELTSTSSSAMGQQLLSTNQEEKSDSNDTLPTSSTDASTSIKSTHLVSDDPISSTSSEMDPSKSKPAADQLSFDVDKGVNCFDSDVELFGMSISTERTEAIEENVDDLVNDLETLLGESTDDFNVPKNSPKSEASAIQTESCQNATEKVDTTVYSEKAIEEKRKEQNHVAQDEVESEQPLQKVEEPIKDTIKISTIPVDLESTANQDDEVCEEKALQDAAPESTPEVPQEEADKAPQSIEAPQAQTEESDLSSTKDHKEATAVVSSSHSPLLHSTEQEIPIADEDPIQSNDTEENIPADMSSALTITESIQEDPINFPTEEQGEEIPENVKKEQMESHDAEPVEAGIVVEEVKEGDDEITNENTQETSAPAAPETEHSKVDASLHVQEAQEPMQVDEEVKASEETSEPGKEEIAIDATIPSLNTEMVPTEKPKKTPEMQADIEMSSAKETIELPTDIKMVSAEEPKAPGKEEIAIDATIPNLNIEMAPTEKPKKTPEIQADIEMSSAKETIELPTDIKMDSAEEPKETIEPPTYIQISSAKEPKEAMELPSDMEVVSAEEPTETPEPQTDPIVDEFPTAIQDPDENSSDIVHPESDCQAVDLKQVNEDKVQSIGTVLQRTEDSLQAEENQIQPKEDGIHSAQNLVHTAEDVRDAKEVPSLVEESAIDNAKSQEEKPLIEPTEALECITQEAEDIKESTITQDMLNQPQNECDALPTSTISMKENIEIEEVTDDLKSAELMDIPAAVEEPEDEIPVVKEPKVDEEDSIMEVTNEQIAQEHLEEIQVDPEVASSDQKLSLHGDIADSVVSEGDAVDKTVEKMNSCENLPDVMLSKVTVSTEENSQVAKEVEPVEEILTAAKVKEVVKTESIEILGSRDEHAPTELPSDNVIADEATIVKTEELSVADKTVSDKIEENAKPVEREDVICQKNTKNVIETVKSKPEIMIRRKTVEQDLEKVVCLSEESSDSECNGPTSDKPMQVLPALDEDANLVKIPSEVEHFPDPKLPIEENIQIEDNAPVEAQADVESIIAASNLETLLAVASLQNESVPDTREHRRLSENEIREMEAIRMAVASITDSSQDTYDSFMVENSMTMDNSTQDEQDVQDISNLPAELIAEDTNIEEIARFDKSSEEVACATALVDSNIPLQQSSVKLVEVAENNTPIASTATLVNVGEADTCTIDNNSQVYGDNIPEESSNATEPGRDNEEVLPSEAAKYVVEVAKEEFSLMANIEQPCVASSTSKSPNPAVEISEKDIVKEPKVPTSDPVQILDDPVVIPAVADAPSVDAEHYDDGSNNKSTDNEEQVAAEIAKTPNENNILAAHSATNSAAVKQLVEEKSPRNRSKRSSKISEPLTINVEEVEKREKVYSPKITIKPLKVPDEEVSTTSEADANKGSLKMTITKQSDKMHSILKLYNPEDEPDMLPQTQEEPIPKLIIKPKLQHVEQQHSPKMTTRSAKVCSPTSTRCSSPRITIKPVPKPADVKLDVLSPLKITIKPVVKPDDATRKHSPKAVKDADQQKNHNLKITIKPIPRPMEEKEDIRPSTPKLIIKPIPKPAEGLTKEELSVSPPKLTIRALKRPLEETDLDNEPERSSPKITIKPLVKPAEHDSSQQSIQTTPKLKIRSVRRHDDGDLSSEVDREEGSPKISIKPLLKPPDIELDDDEEVKERIVLKINKGNLPLNKESKKREHPDEDKGEKVGIKLKFSTTGGHTHIVQEKEDGSKRPRKDSGYLSSVAKKETEENPHKRLMEDKLPEKSKRLRSALTPDNLAESSAPDKLDPKIPYPLAGISEDRSQVIKNVQHSETPDISKIAALAAQTTHIEAPSVVTVGIATPTVTPGPKKRGRPRKVPLKFREDSDATISSPITPQTTPSSDPITPVGSESLIVEPTSSGGRPKRSCRGQNVMATLGIKPRKPRGRGRGSKVNMGDRGPPTPAQVAVEITAEVPAKPDKAEKGAKAKLKFGRKSSEQEILNQDTEAKAKETAKSTQESIGKEGSSQENKADLEAKPAETTQEHSLEESLKQNCQDPEDHAPKGKKDDKTPTRKLEVTTRRQKAQLQRKSDDFSPIDAAPSSSQPTHSPDATAVPPPAPYKHPLTDQEKFVRELNSKNYPDITITKSNSGPTVSENPIEKPVEASVVKCEDRLSVDSSKKDTTLDEEDDEDLGQDGETIELGDDSESERQREHVLQKKQEAIKKCRAKRMEKLARAAELKRKRQEQAAQQREARKAAEKAERVATEKARATKRYGRYGVPKPQISLIDAPVQESAGTVKSHVGDSPTKPANQPASIEDQADKEDLKNIEGHFIASKSPQKLLFSEPMVVDLPEESPVKIRRSLAREDVIMVDEETRMSADFRGSRSQTPAKQGAQPADIMVEDSQGSIGTEGCKSRSSKAPKMEVFQDLESAAYSADQLAEYSWNGQGPFMIQEQVTHYLGIKSFKRKYPNMTRRAVDIQERDYLKESGQVTEAQCDLGLTAVAAQDILDIMYADFQDKYEDYCKAQREKQARELANKQKALNQFTLKPGFDKLDILEQAVQSAAAWNSQFNKARREQRRAHMDLQNWSIHYPKSKMKILPAPKIGHYPIALVPGQFTDYYRDYTPTELNNLPLNTMCYDEIKVSRPPAESEESSNGSDSDSESSSGSSSSGSSCNDANCKECDSDKNVKKTNEVRETDSDDVVFVENDASSSDSVVLVSVTSGPVTT